MSQAKMRQASILLLLMTLIAEASLESKSLVKYIFNSNPYRSTDKNDQILWMIH